MMIFNSCKKTDLPEPNRPPTAHAENVLPIQLPRNDIYLVGSGKDPEGKKITYEWMKISGPSSCTILYAHLNETKVTDLIAGNYQFELKVTDEEGLFSTDTTEVTVYPASKNNIPKTGNCDISNRTRVEAQMTSLGSLSQTREGITVSSAGNKILFAGGFNGPGNIPSSRVDIYDINNNTFTTAELSEARYNLTTTVLGNKIFFAGGNKEKGFSSRVDIYDVVFNTWTTAELSLERALMAGAAAVDKVLFAGGVGPQIYPHSSGNPVVDIYDVSNNTWTTAHLSNRIGNNVGEVGIAATVIGTKIYLAGNASDWLAWDFGSFSSTINIYDASTGIWSISNLSIPKGFMAGIAVDNKNYWAGGVYNQNEKITDQVEIRDMNTGLSSFACLFQPNAFISAVESNNKIIFFTTANDYFRNFTDKFDFYDITTDTWSIGILPQRMYGSCIISVNNIIYVAGGFVNGEISSQLWQLNL